MDVLFTDPKVLQEIGIGVFSFVAGRVWSKRNAVGAVLLFRAALLVIQMAKHYYDTHPEALKKKPSTLIDDKFNNLYNKYVLPHQLKEAHETGAQG